MATSEEAAGQDAGSSGITLHKILAYAVKYGASDIHLKVPRPPAVRIDGVIRFIGDTPLTQDDMLRFLDDILTPEQKARFLEVGDADCALGVPGLGRFRVNCLKQRGTVGIVLRHVKGKAPNFDMLNLPEASMMKIVEMRRGLVLVTGTTGSGKSTTLAAIIDKINQTRPDHIVTLEDPIEFLHTDKRSSITQREVSIDTRDFKTALRAVMREDPDVILIGEMRDNETFQACISAAETGHLVFSTLHTTNAMMTIDRILDLFPAEQHQQVRSQLALQLRALVAQRLVPSADGKGRVPAVEVMFNTPAIAALIRENQLKLIGNAIAGGKEDGMQTFNMSLVDLVNRKLIRQEDAELASDNPDELKMNLQGIYLSQGRGGILKR
ncbi:MAG TPA: type IV pilus twitching motility protein PilT [Candidatus Hydrogenedentes bacterium]|nr:type IV pilus twitching motility protein PilT [Candidatus Hydrogenedentota bacterium]HPC18383.1 type IV pilus twitching motility protein PilT [Candidatus Hydrogenedentota bacterium]HRT22140.1 type IV pilus twitching motility protein PilT [Candidatus Hydrogenedentota bacterium]HRT66869.1 type IV pilus twitching motility protein PilT [Candidatus Hydrogenedentota bacterium]